MSTEQDIQRKAKAYALDWINHQRVSAGKPAVKNIGNLWWRIHGQKWIDAIRSGQGKPEGF